MAKKPTRKSSKPSRAQAPRKAPRATRKAVRSAAKPRKGAKKAARKPVREVGKARLAKAKPSALRAKPVRSAPARRTGQATAGPAQAKPADVKLTQRRAPSAEARPLKIVLFGASGNLGSRIAKEALARGQHVTAVMRNPARLSLRHENLRAMRADATDPLLVATVARGHDVIISAIGATPDSPESLAQAATSMMQGAREVGIKRVMVVNGAGSLEVSKGKLLMDTPQFPADWRWVAKAHRDALAVLRARGSDLDWTAVSPAAMIEPGKRTGNFRLGGDQLLADAKGQSRISMEDYAAAFMDELESERYVGRRMSVAY